VTVSELIKRLVDDVQAGRCSKDSEVMSADGLALRPRIYLGQVLMEYEPRLALANEPDTRD
jgi:hypothetical protein